MRSSFVLVLGMLAMTSQVRAQTLQGERMADVSLGRWKELEGGGTFGLRHDHSFAIRTPGLRREDVYFTGSLRVPFRYTDLALGTYLAWQDVGRFWYPDDEAKQPRNDVPGNGEASFFAFVSVPLGDFGLRLGVVPPLLNDDSEWTWKTAVSASRTRPVDLVQLLPRTKALRSSLHYRLDFGVLFFQADVGLDYRWSTSNSRVHRQNESGDIVHMALAMGLGFSNWGVSYSMAHVWVAQRIFDHDETDALWKTSVTPNGNRSRGAAHSMALHWYRRHCSPYVGITLIPRRRVATALALGVDYAF